MRGALGWGGWARGSGCWKVWSRCLLRKKGKRGFCGIVGGGGGVVGGGGGVVGGGGVGGWEAWVE